MSVDDTLTNGGLRDLAVANRDLRPGALTFASAPVGSFGREGAQAVDYLDEKGSAELWTAIRNGRLPPLWLRIRAQVSVEPLPDPVREAQPYLETMIDPTVQCHASLFAP